MDENIQRVMKVPCLNCDQPIEVLPNVVGGPNWEVIGDDYRHVDVYNEDEWDLFQGKCDEAAEILKLNAL